MSRRGIARSRDNFGVNFPRGFGLRLNAATPFYSAGSSVLQLHQHAFSALSILAVLVGVKRYRVAVSICISPVTNGIEHLFMCSMSLNQRQDRVRWPRLRLCVTGKCIRRMRFLLLVSPGRGVGSPGPALLPRVAEEVEPTSFSYTGTPGPDSE